jgi:hypothetical protein
MLILYCRVRQRESINCCSPLASVHPLSLMMNQFMHDSDVSSSRNLQNYSDFRIFTLLMRDNSVKSFTGVGFHPNLGVFIFDGNSKILNV